MPEGSWVLSRDKAVFNIEALKNDTFVFLHSGNQILQSGFSFHEALEWDSISSVCKPGAGFNGRVNNLILILRYVQTT